MEFSLFFVKKFEITTVACRCLNSYNHCDLIIYDQTWKKVGSRDSEGHAFALATRLRNILNFSRVLQGRILRNHIELSAI